MSKRETSAEIDEAAALWATRIDDAVLGGAEQAELDAWLQADIRRLGAFVRAQVVLVHVRRAKALGSEFDPASFDHDRDAAEIIAEMPAEERPAPAGLTRRKMFIGASAIAASGALAIFVPIGRASARIYETSRGESRLVPLDDGSTVTLNTDSRIAVTIDDAQRRVQLVHGEALFKVATAKGAPFIVDAGDASLRARKATFAVCRLGAQPLQVKVCDGDVEVARAAAATRLLHANMQAILPSDGTIIERGVTAQALQRDLAWQEGMLSFEDTPLSTAAQQFARYSNRKIQIADPAVAAETVTGRYAANNPEGFAQAVALGLDLHMQSTPAGITLAR